MQASKVRNASISRAYAVLFFAVGATVLPVPALAQGKAGCQRETISVLTSPDDTWVALVQEDVCSDGFFVTTITDTIQLTRRDATGVIQLATHPDKPKHENDVFALDEHGDPENRPLTRWLSPTKLQVTVPNKSLIGLHKTSYEGIEIVVKYEPDDPVERQRWLKSLGLAPN
ncbi:MAG TPA: hypothetical protein VG986_13315 [Pseudolabrys sp.]|nr:hypothetical protein [Pseudolabrys sp.]